MVTTADYKSIQPAWCPGCGDFGILNALKKAVVHLAIEPRELCLCSGIGQAAKLPHYIKCNVFNGLHGRGLPAATGVKIANHTLHVVVVGGDGDMYGEGGNHFIHAIRRNLNLTLLVHDNRIYGLTKGQASPTTDQGIKTKVQPQGVMNFPLNPIALAISQGCSFVARSFSGDNEHLSNTIQQGIEHDGFSLIDILQPCVSFNKLNTHSWYKERIYSLNDESTYDSSNMQAALNRSFELGDKIPVGVFYKNNRATFESHWDVLKTKPLVDHKIDHHKVDKIIQQYM